MRGTGFHTSWVTGCPGSPEDFGSPTKGGDSCEADTKRIGVWGSFPGLLKLVHGDPFAAASEKF